MIEKIEDIREKIIPEKEEAARFATKIKIAKDLTNGTYSTT
jgi:hypothetical protein